jgi:hypothetical protein
MRNPSEQRTRREFFCDLARGLALGGLALLSASLAARSWSKAGPQDCTEDGICRDCRSLDRCRLPQALSAKQARERGQ